MMHTSFLHSDAYLTINSTINCYRAFIFFACRKEDIRKSIKQVLLAFCNRAILTIFGLMAGYVCVVTNFLFNVGVWNFSQLKNTIIWFVFVAAVELFKANKIHQEKEYFKKSLSGHFKILVAVEFIVAFHSFSLIAELIIVPLSTMTMLLFEVSKLKEEHKPVEKLMEWVLVIFSVCMVGLGLYFISSNFQEFAQPKILMDFSTPIILSILLLPFIFVMSTYMLYERILIRVNILTENKFCRAYAKFKGIIHFKSDHESLNKWLAFSCKSDFESRKTIDESIASFKANETELVSNKGPGL